MFSIWKSSSDGHLDERGKKIFCRKAVVAVAVVDDFVDIVADAAVVFVFVDVEERFFDGVP